MSKVDFFFFWIVQKPKIIIIIIISQGSGFGLLATEPVKKGFAFGKTT
jgi:hypothetical protein